MDQKDEALVEGLSNVEVETSEDVEVIPNFDAMGLKEKLLQGIHAHGFEKPSAIQQRAIKPIVEGRNVIIQDQPNNGKTATLSIAILQCLDTSLNETQVLCLSPTRNLAVHIQQAILDLGDFMNVQCNICIGGTHFKENKMILQNGQHVISGTPGRVLDMIKRADLCTSTIKMLVLNGDKLLKTDFKKQLDKICHHLTSHKQVLLSSTPLNPEILKVSSHFVKDPIIILAKRNSKESGTNIANEPRKKIKFGNKSKLQEFSNDNQQTGFEHLKSASKSQLINQCLQIEDAQRRMYMSQIKIINKKVQELTKEIHDLRVQIKRPWLLSAAERTSPLSAPATGAACQPTPIDSLKEKSNSYMSRSSSSSNEDRKEQEVVDDNDQLMKNLYEDYKNFQLLDDEDDNMDVEFAKNTSNDGQQHEHNPKIN